MHVIDGSTAAVVQVPVHALPDLISAHETALTRLGPMLNNLGQVGRIPEPWTHDPVARDITARFNDYAVDGPNSAYSCLRLYEAEVRRVLETLREMHANYSATEDAVTGRMRSL
ncbi:MAG: hypothetical protein H0X35_04865 [Pseudonocardiales bacterium]|nr:hypothetical protein [Pseudonocardiales bacterium]